MTCLTGHKRFDIWGFFLAAMASHSLLLELGCMGWHLSGHEWFMKLSLVSATGGEQSLTITYLPIKAFATTVFIAWKVSKYGVISGPYFPAFWLNSEIY